MRDRRRAQWGEAWGAWRALFLLLLLLATAPASAAPDAGARAIPDRAKPEGLPLTAVGRGIFEGDEPQLEARLLVSHADGLRAGVLIDLAPGWHVYWRNPGESGIAPTLGIDAAGYRAGDVDWPAPEIFEEGDGLFTTYGYSERVLLSVPLERDAGAEAGDKVIARPEILACLTECIPASFELSSPLEVGLSDDDQAEVETLFARFRARAPVSGDAFGLAASARWSPTAPSGSEPGRLELDVSACPDGREDCRDGIARSGPLFLLLEDQPFELSDVRIAERDGARGTATLSMQVERLEDGEDRLQGVVALELADGSARHVRIDVPIEAAAATPVAAAPIGVAGWLHVALLALVGGLILNGMPCVLPVLAIKVVAVADLAEKAPREVRVQGLAYTAGVLGSMGGLAAIVLGLRSAGHSVGWGFQFQEPLFVAAISAVLVTFALNLFGVFEIDFGQGRLATVGQSGSPTRRSVFEGLLAVVLATPCTAPFLGTAVGFAFAAEAAGIVAIFLAIGLGLALPFLAVSFVPSLARFIPRSGPWMLKLRACLGFCLLATVVWLLWVVGQSGGADAVAGLAGMLLLVAFLLWVFGQMQPLRSAWLARASALAIAGVAFAGFNLIGLQSQTAPTASTEQPDPGGWMPYSEAAVEEALLAGRPAFVVFTADWCITCQVNEKTVLERESVRNAFAAGDFALFKADWTRRDEGIRTKLAEFGRAGVPLYLVYSPDAPGQPRILSELLSQGEVLAAIAEPRLASRR